MNGNVLSSKWEFVLEANAQSQSASLGLSITGMTCGSCARVVERALSRVPGVERASVDPDLGLAVVLGTAAMADLIAATEAAGYGARPAEEPKAEGKSNERHRSG